MRKYIASVALCVMAHLTPVQAQDFNNYKPLVAEGLIPKEFLTPSSQKYKAEIKKISENARRKEKKTRDQFAKETNFILDDMLQSGLVIFNDKVTNYLNQVVNTLVEKNEPKLSKLKVYTLRSPVVNAFATSRGEVFVTLGLLAQMENEAQLAFVLAHELTHIEEQHSIELYLESNGVGKNSSNKDVLKNAQLSDKMLSKHNYKKELEAEADKKGLQRFLKTKYSTASIRDVFDVLKYAYLPFDNDSFDVRIFQNDRYILPNSYHLPKVKAINGEQEDEDDAKSTHPNIASRKANLNDALKNVTDTDKKDYVVSKEKFTELQQIARFELPLLHLKSEEFPKAIYTTYLLLKKYPESIFLKKCMAKALYYQAKYKNDSDYSYDSMYKDIEGESQQVHYLMEEIKANEMTVLAMRYAYQVLLKYPKDTEMKAITDDLAILLADNKLAAKDFVSAADLKDKTAESAKTAVKDSIQTTKLEKIRSQKTQNTEGDGAYWHTAFLEFKDNPDFIKTLEEGAKTAKKRKEIAEYYDSSKGQKEWEREQKQDKKKGYKLGIDKIVVVNPTYSRLDARKKILVDYIGTEEGQINLRDMIKEVAPKSALKVEVLDINNLTEKQVEQFNQVRFLNEWFSEQVNRYNLSLTPSTQQAAIDSIAQKYGTDYFLWTGIVSLRERPKGVKVSILGGLLYPAALPYFLYDAYKPRYDMMYYAILYDVKTGRRQVINFDYFNEKDTEAMIKSHLYDVFLQIKSKAKK
jgi:beta-barrel assembly-enhancing protease